MTKNDILEALQEAIRLVKTQKELANQSGLSQGRISNYLNKKCDIGNMTIDTLLSLFPNIIIDFFGKNKDFSINASMKNSRHNKVLSDNQFIVESNQLKFELIQNQISEILTENNLSDSDKIKFIAILNKQVT